MNLLNPSELQIREWMRVLSEPSSPEAVAFASTNILIAFRQKEEAVKLLEAELKSRPALRLVQGGGK